MTLARDRKILIIGNGPSTGEIVDLGLENLRPDVDTFGMGAAYRFFRLKPYPCELEDPDAWGNLLAFSVRSRALPAGQSVQQEHAS